MEQQTAALAQPLFLSLARPVPVETGERVRNRIRTSSIIVAICALVVVLAR
jgi:hypothetical protein